MYSSSNVQALSSRSTTIVLGLECPGLGLATYDLVLGLECPGLVLGTYDLVLGLECPGLGLGTYDLVLVLECPGLVLVLVRLQAFLDNNDMLPATHVGISSVSQY